nr:G protein-coupled receptor [Proales similis]
MTRLSRTSELAVIVQHVLIGVLGTIGNLLVLVVYKKRLRDNQTITFLIVHLAVADLVCCLFLMPLNCYHELNIGNITSDFMCKFHSFLNVINITYSCLMMTLVSVERYFCIVHPFAKVLTKSRAKTLLAALFVACFWLALAGGLAIGIYHRVARLEHNITISIDDLHEGGLFVTPNRSFADNKPVSAGPSDSSITAGNSIYNSAMPKFNLKDLKFNWMPTYHCFPNDRLISIQAFSYIRLAQNLIVVICFALIFVLYGIIFGHVNRRHRLKHNRDIYYQHIIKKSREANSQYSPPAPQKHLELELLSVSCSHDDKLDRQHLTRTVTNEGTIGDCDEQDRAKQADARQSSPERQCLLQKASASPKAISLTSEVGLDQIPPSNPDECGGHKFDEKATQTNKSSISALKKTNTLSVASSQKQCHAGSRSILEEYHSTRKIIYANLRTAFMLFVATVIMAVVFSPALLTSLGYIEYNPITWNLVYINNAVNPIVYSFLNANFRSDLRNLISKKRRKQSH